MFVLYVSERSLAFISMTLYFPLPNLLLHGTSKYLVCSNFTDVLYWRCCIRSYHVIQIYIYKKKQTFGYTYNDGKEERQAMFSSMQVHSQAVCTGQSVCLRAVFLYVIIRFQCTGEELGKNRQ